MKQQLINEWQEESLLSWEDFLVSQVKENREIISKMIRATNIEIVILREHSLKANMRIEELTIKLIEAEMNIETPGN